MNISELEAKTIEELMAMATPRIMISPALNTGRR